MTVELDESDARRCAYLLAMLARDARLAGRHVPHEADKLVEHLTHQIVTRSRQRCRVTERESDPMERVGTKWVAARLGWSRSTVLRNAHDLDGQIVGGAYTFDRATIERIAQQKTGV